MPRLDVTQCEGSYLRVRVPLLVVNGGGADENNLVSYVKEQDKSESERARARQNIGISDDMYEFIESGVGTYLTPDNETIKVSEVDDDKVMYAIDCKLDDENGIRVNGVSIGGYNDGDVINEGTKIWDVLRKILSKVIDVRAVLPTIKLNSAMSSADRAKVDNGKIEIGETLTQEFSVTQTNGKFEGLSGYTYTIDAGCEWGSNVSYKKGYENIGSTDVSTFGTEGNVTFTASLDYGASTVVPVKNDGTPSEVRIESGTATSSITYNVTKKVFYGNVSGQITDSDEIRELDYVWSGAVTLEIANIGTGVLVVMPNNRSISEAKTGNNQIWKNSVIDEFTYYDVVIKYANNTEQNPSVETYKAAMVIPATPMDTSVTIKIS